MALLQIKGLTKVFGGLHALDNININVPEGLILSIIGPNGAGKTTVFNCITGLYSQEKGDIFFNGENLSGAKPHQIAQKGIARTFQNIRLFAGMTVMENVMVAGQSHSKIGILNVLFKGKSYVKEESNLITKSHEILHFTGIYHHAHKYACNLAYGDQRRLELARALALNPKLILLDEPAAGMNPQETKDIMELIFKIRKNGVTIILIEHDMKVVMGISEHIVVLDHGIKIAEGSPSEIQKNPKVIEAYLGKEI